MLGLFKPKRKNVSSRIETAKGPPGKRCYAIGDVHGCLDLLIELLDKIKADNASRPEAETFVVFLGDLIDRGPDSKGVIDLLINHPPEFARCIILRGNHEVALLNGVSGDTGSLQTWLNHGGMQCANSYGVSSSELLGAAPDAIEAVLIQAIPATHFEFMRQFKDSAKFGDYFFVHAGLRPGLPLDQQRKDDFYWIRDEFLTSEYDFGMVVVHGHSITERAEERSNRIGIDTGAYNSGILTALCIDGAQRNYLQVR